MNFSIFYFEKNLLYYYIIYIIYILTYFSLVHLDLKSFSVKSLSEINNKR